MELMRRSASGELSELFGAATLPLDRMMRTLGLRQRVVADLPRLPPDARALLDAYARGVNAWIALRGRFAAPEFVAFGAPRPWTRGGQPALGQDDVALPRRQLADGAGAAGAGRDHAAGEGRRAVAAGGGGGHPEARASDPALARVRGAARGCHPALSRAVHAAGHGEQRLGGGRAPHRDRRPAARRRPASGLRLPGHLVPGAHRDAAATCWPAPPRPACRCWCSATTATSPGRFTTTGADVQDLFVETPAGQATSMRPPTGPARSSLREEHIRVRGAPDEVMMVRETRHGPVISDLVDPHGPVLALAACRTWRRATPRRPACSPSTAPTMSRRPGRRRPLITTPGAEPDGSRPRRGSRCSSPAGCRSAPAATARARCPAPTGAMTGSAGRAASSCRTTSRPRAAGW